MWLDPSEASETSMANSRFNFGKLIKDGLSIREGVKMRPSSRVTKNREAKRKGQHMGVGKREGYRKARMPIKVSWMRHQRVLRRLSRKHRQAKEIDKHLYHFFDRKPKGYTCENKRVPMEAIHKMKAESRKDDEDGLTVEIVHKGFLARKKKRGNDSKYFVLCADSFRYYDSLQEFDRDYAPRAQIMLYDISELQTIGVSGFFLSVGEKEIELQCVAGAGAPKRLANSSISAKGSKTNGIMKRSPRSAKRKRNGRWKRNWRDNILSRRRRGRAERGGPR